MSETTISFLQSSNDEKMSFNSLFCCSIAFYPSAVCASVVHDGFISFFCMEYAYITSPIVRNKISKIIWRSVFEFFKIQTIKQNLFCIASCNWILLIFFVPLTTGILMENTNTEKTPIYGSILILKTITTTRVNVWNVLIFKGLILTLFRKFLSHII